MIRFSERFSTDRFIFAIPPVHQVYSTYLVALQVDDRMVSMGCELASRSDGER